MIAFVGVNPLGGFWPLVVLSFLAMGYLFSLAAWCVLVAGVRMWHKSRPLPDESLTESRHQRDDSMFGK